MKRWKIDVIKIVNADGIKSFWKWEPLPPAGIIWECLRDRVCTQCHGTVSPFIFIGKLPDGRYMAFRRPPWLLKNGCTGLVLIPPPAPTLFSQPPQAQAQPAPVDAKTQVIRVVDLPNQKLAGKPVRPKKRPAPKTPRRPVKKVPAEPVKKAAKKTPKKAAKKTSRHRRAP